MNRCAVHSLKTIDSSRGVSIFLLHKDWHLICYIHIYDFVIIHLYIKVLVSGFSQQDFEKVWVILDVSWIAWFFWSCCTTKYHNRWLKKISAIYCLCFGLTDSQTKVSAAESPSLWNLKELFFTYLFLVSQVFFAFVIAWFSHIYISVSFLLLIW